VTARGVDDHQLLRHAACFPEERHPLVLAEMTVEMTGEDAGEAVVREGQREAVTLDVRRMWRLAHRLGEHPGALVEADDVAADVPGQEAGAAGDVERATRR